MCCCSSFSFEELYLLLSALYDLFLPTARRLTLSVEREMRPLSLALTRHGPAASACRDCRVTSAAPAYCTVLYSIPRPPQRAVRGLPHYRTARVVLRLRYAHPHAHVLFACVVCVGARVKARPRADTNTFYYPNTFTLGVGGFGMGVGGFGKT